ncbi:protein kinase [Kitasatospora sp. NPDC002227]|uniref:serine/threonine-protein kinase n=1 Tax=Kitasatospora sp. NPDC002227 TaxID=3154773 RepID=UPI00331A4029
MWGQGTELGGRYTLVERLGGGGMGDVWRADDGVLERPVAVKILLPSLLDDPEFAKRFRQEAKLLATLRHPGIVAVHDYGESELGPGLRVAYIVMELIDGRPLDTLLAEQGPLPAERVLTIAAEALDALHVAHRQDVVHRDIKPSNLMVREDGRVTVTDFGIASATAGTKITASHAVLGTALYVAPEQAEGAAVTPAADLYSLGVVCYELLTGSLPFNGTNVLEVVLKHVREAAPELPVRFPRPVRELVARALAKRPEDRHPDAAAMAAAARAALTGEEPVGGAPAKGAAFGGAVAGGGLGRGTAFGGAVFGGPAAGGPAAGGPAAGGAAGGGGGGEEPTVPLREPVVAPVAEPKAEPVPVAVAAEPRRRAPRLLVPLIIPCVITAGAGTVWMVDQGPFRSDAASGAHATAPAPAAGGLGSATVSPGSATPGSPSGAASGTPGSGTPVPSSAPPGAGAAVVPGLTGGQVPPPGSGQQPGSPQGGGATSGGNSSTSGGNNGGNGGTSGGGGKGGSTGTAPQPPASSAPSVPRPPARPDGCGGAGDVVSVASGLKLGLAKGDLSGGVALVTGGHTEFGWVRGAPGVNGWQSLYACSTGNPEVGVGGYGQGAVELAGGYGDVLTWLFSSVNNSAHTFTVRMYPTGQYCLTAGAGSGSPVTVTMCDPGNRAQQWTLS